MSFSSEDICRSCYIHLNWIYSGELWWTLFCNNLLTIQQINYMRKQPTESVRALKPKPDTTGWWVTKVNLRRNFSPDNLQHRVVSSVTVSTSPPCWCPALWRCHLERFSIELSLQSKSYHWHKLLYQRHGLIWVYTVKSNPVLAPVWRYYSKTPIICLFILPLNSTLIVHCSHYTRIM